MPIMYIKRHLNLDSGTDYIECMFLRISADIFLSFEKRRLCHEDPGSGRSVFNPSRECKLYPGRGRNRCRSNLPPCFIRSGPGKVGFMIDDLVSRGIQVKGSFGNTWEDVKGVYEYFATGRLTPQNTLVKFDEIGEDLELLKKGGVKGRLAATVEE